MTAKEAVKLIPCGATVAISGFVGMGHPEEISKAVEESFLTSGVPNHLTLTYGASQNDGKSNWGLNRWCKEGLISRIIAGHFNLQPDMIQLINQEKVEAYAVPQGVMMHLYRAIGGKKPGVITPVGLKTFADPRETGCRMNKRSRTEIVKLIELEGKEYLWYKPFPIDIAVIRGTTADELGNISIEKEAIRLEFYVQALAAHNCGGKVIVQVERVTEAGMIDPRDVVVPGTLVDAVVIAKPENHWQSMAEPYNPALTGDVRLPLSTIEPIPLNERKIVCRRAAMEFIPQAVINFGIGMPDGVASVVAEEGFIDILTATVEPGVIGGVPCGGLRFGCAVNPLAIIDHPSMFDFYDGGGLDIAFLGMGELDQYGNVNVSKFGPRIPGPGGFVNITQASKSVVFCGTFTASGLQVDIKDSQLKIISEGQVKKLVPKVEHITFSGEYAREKGQKVVYVTERAVFAIQSAGLTLIEIAPGVDLDKDVVGQMGFSPRIAADLKRMDARIFRESPMGIKNEILAKAR